MKKQGCNQVTVFSALLENIPFFLLIACGGWLSGMLLPALAAGYLVYSCLALGIFMKNVCLYCGHMKKRNCPAGYHFIAGRFFNTPGHRDFASQYTRYAPVLYPLWFVPPLARAYLLIFAYSLPVLISLLLFCGNGFLVLPLVARYFTCRKCENKTQCPRYRG